MVKLRFVARLSVVIAVVVIAGGNYSTARAWQGESLTVEWSTFLGSPFNDYSQGVAVDNKGNILIVGTSGDWGMPLHPHAGLVDIFLAKLDQNGILLWNTFEGVIYQDYGQAIALDSIGNIYVTGYSPYRGGNLGRVLKYNTNGEKIWEWNSVEYGTCRAIKIDGNDNVYIAGSDYKFGDRQSDAFVIKLDKNGNFLWHFFTGSTGDDIGLGIAVGNNGASYLSGYSGEWGLPVNPHSGEYDAFVAKLDPDGQLVWNTFIGTSENDVATGIAMDSNGNLMVAGGSGGDYMAWTPWETLNGFVAKVNENGQVLWKTSTGTLNTSAIAVDGRGNSYVTGSCMGLCVAKVNSIGVVGWKESLGTQHAGVHGTAIAVDENGTLVVAGDSPWSEQSDMLIIKLKQNPRDHSVTPRMPLGYLFLLSKGR